MTRGSKAQAQQLWHAGLAALINCGLLLKVKVKSESEVKLLSCV